MFRPHFAHSEQELWHLIRPSETIANANQVYTVQISTALEQPIFTPISKPSVSSWHLNTFNYTLIRKEWRRD